MRYGSLVIKTEDAAQQTFKEMLNPDNAKHALRKTGLYEAGFSGLCFNLRRNWEQLASIPIRELTFDQLDAGQRLSATQNTSRALSFQL